MPIDRHRDVAQLEARSGGGLDQGEHRARPPGGSVGVDVVGVGVWVRGVAVGRVDVLGPVDDRILHPADAIDLAADPVARLEEDRRDRGRRRRRPACRSR